MDPVAEFLAKGGKINKIEPGKGMNLTERQWHKIVRSETPVVGSMDYLREMGFVKEANNMVRGK